MPQGMLIYGEILWNVVFGVSGFRVGSCEAPGVTTSLTSSEIPIQWHPDVPRGCGVHPGCPREADPGREQMEARLERKVEVGGIQERAPRGDTPVWCHLAVLWVQPGRRSCGIQGVPVGHRDPPLTSGSHTPEGALEQ